MTRPATGHPYNLAQTGLRLRTSYHEAGHCTAALAYGVPIISVSIDPAHPHMLRDHYRVPPRIGLEAMCIVCLSGPAAESFYFGPITDGSDQIDLQMAKDYLARAGNDPLQIGAGIYQARAAADRLVRTETDRIITIAAYLMDYETLSGQDIEQLIRTGTVA